MEATKAIKVSVGGGVLERAADLTERVVDGELVIYDPRLQRVHALNSTAAYIWKACDTTPAVSRVIDDLCERYPDNRELIERDVVDTVSAFVREGLLVS